NKVATRDEKWVPFTERVKISSANVTLETTVPQKEETFQVVQGTDSYEFLFANKKCMVNVDVFRTILDICPRVEGVNFTNVPDDDTTLAFLIKLGYKGPVYKHTNMFADHMHQPWRTLAPIPLKKSRDKGLQRKKTADESQETVDVSEESESKPEPEPVKRKTSSKRRVNKKVTLSVDDKIVFDDPDTALELGKIVTRSVLEPNKRRNLGTFDPPKELKGFPSLTTEEQEATDIMQALKKARRLARDNQVLEAQVKELVLYRGFSMKQESKYSVKDRLDDEEKDDKKGDAGDEDDETKYDEDDIYKYKIYVHKVEDEEMLNSKVDDSNKGNEELTDAAKVDAEKTLELKDDDKKTKLPPTSSSLFVSLGFALIDDENAMDKGVADIFQDHKRKHDDDEDNDDEDPLARPKQGSKTSKSASAIEPVKEPIAEVVMDDAGDDVVHDDDQPQDASEPKTSKTLNPEWFTQPRPPTHDPECKKHQVVLDQPEQTWFNQMVFATKYPLTFDDLMATPVDFFNIELEYHFQECFNELTDMLVWNNLKSDHYPFDLSKPLPLKGHPGHLIVAADYFFNNYMEYLKSFDPKGIEDMVPTLWSPTKVRYGHLEEIMVKRADHQFYKFKEGDYVDLHLNEIEDMLLLAVQHNLFHLTDIDIVDFIVASLMFTRSLVIKKRVEDLQLGVERVICKDLTKQKRVIRADELYKFSDMTLKKVQDELHHRIRNFCLEYNKEMPRIKYTAIDRKRSEIMVKLIDKQKRERRIIQNLERLVGAQELEIDYKLMTHTT
nr:hypothetical protein [Tanacetum cinerariifolium]